MSFHVVRSRRPAGGGRERTGPEQVRVGNASESQVSGRNCRFPPLSRGRLEPRGLGAQRAEDLSH